MKFRYARYGKALRPVIPVTLLHNSQKLGYQVLVDSGADICLFDAEIGVSIGIDIKAGIPKTVFGVGGKSSLYYVHKVTIDVGGWEHEIEAGFMPNVSGRIMQYGLVGQQGFFSNFIVKFDLNKEEIEIKTSSVK